MLTLRSSPASPFGRKVKVAAAILGLIDQIDIVVADTMSADDPLRRQNPLGKIPALVTEDGTAVYDSRVIEAYLDHLAGGGRIIPSCFPDRLHVLVREALADGVMDAALLIVYEGRFRPNERHEQKWLDHQRGKVMRGLAALALDPPRLDRGLHVDAIATACLLEYLEFRLGDIWRADHPALVTFLTEFRAAVPAFEKTRPA